MDLATEPLARQVRGLPWLVNLLRGAPPRWSVFEGLGQVIHRELPLEARLLPGRGARLIEKINMENTYMFF